MLSAKAFEVLQRATVVLTNANAKVAEAEAALSELPDNASKRSIAKLQKTIADAKAEAEAASVAVDHAIAGLDAAIAEDNAEADRLLSDPRTVGIADFVTRLIDFLDGYAETVEDAISLAARKWDRVHLRVDKVGDRPVYGTMPIMVEGKVNRELENAIGLRADVRLALSDQHVDKLNSWIANANAEDLPEDAYTLLGALRRVWIADRYARMAAFNYRCVAAKVLTGRSEARFTDHMEFDRKSGQWQSTVHVKAEDAAKVAEARKTATPNGSTLPRQARKGTPNRWRLVDRMPINMRCFNGRGYTLTIAEDSATLHRADGSVAATQAHNGKSGVAGAVGIVIRAGRQEIEGISNSIGWGLPNECGMPLEDGELVAWDWRAANANADNAA